MGKKEIFGLEKKSIVVLSIIFIFYILVLLQGFKVDISDQNVYFYMGKLIAEGNVPYRDFFYSHPPLEIIVDAVILKIFGFNIFVLKILSIIFTLIASLFLFRIVKQRSALEGFIAVTIFLFTYQIFRMGIGNIGNSLAIMLMIIGIYHSLNNKQLKSGIFFGLAGITSFFTLIPAAIFFFFSTLKMQKGKVSINAKNIKKFLIGFGMTFILINLILIFSTQNYISQVFTYHLEKPAFEIVKGLKLNLFKQMIVYNSFVFLGSLFFLFHNKKRKFSVFWTTIIVYLVMIFFISRNFPHYYDIIIPFLAVLAATGIVAVFRFQKARKISFIIILAFFLLSTYFSITNFSWVMKNTFRNDEYLEISEIIGTAGKDEVIFGDYLLTPLVSLSTKRDIAFNFVDTNPSRFAAGTVDVKKLVSDLNEIEPKYLILRGSNPLLNYEEFKNFIDNNCEIVKIIDLDLPTYFNKRIITEKSYVIDCKR